MRALWIIPVLFSLMLPACGTPQEGSGAGSEGGTGTETEGTSDSTGSTSTPGTTGAVCSPGETVPCACPDGSDGTQTCADDGNSFSACECGGMTSLTTTTNTTMPTTDGTTSGPTTSDPTTDDPTTDGSTTDEPTTDPTGVMCEDPGLEPNETEEQATEHGDQGCNEEFSALGGVLNGGGDVDWHVYHGSWGMGCGFEDPEPTHFLIADEDIRLCAFAECDQEFAGEEVDCLDDSMPADSPSGRPGCCANGNVAFAFNCTNTGNESANVYVRVDGAGDDACVDYLVEYSYAG